MVGDLDVDATVAGISKGVTVDSVEAQGRIALGPSTVGGLKIDRAAVDGTYRGGSGQIRQLELNGPDLGVKANGTIALNTSGQSNLVVRADTSSLETLTGLVNQKAKGIAAVEATITGNRNDLRAAGRLTGNDLEFGGQSALQLSSDFTAQVRDLAFEHADVSATTNATFAVISGQNINQLTAKTEYHDRNVGFDFTAKQPQRSLSADGSLALNPDQNKVSLHRLAFQTENLAWETAPGATAEIVYGDGSVAVKDLRLASNNQEIAVSGTFGRPEDTLQVTAQNVSLATIDALLLRPPMLSGTLNASAEIAGSTDAPKVAGKFDVVQGAFRQARFDSLGGTVNYEGRGLTLDTRLHQSASSWLEAKGYVPVAAFKKAATPGAHRGGSGRKGGRVRSAHPQHADRAGAGAGDDDRPYQRPGHDAGDDRHHGRRRRSASERCDHDRQRRVYGRADRRHLHGSRRAHRARARPHSHRRHRGAGQRPAAAVDHRRSGHSRAAAGRRQRRRDRQELQDHQEQDGRHPDGQRSPDHGRPAAAAHRRRARRDLGRDQPGPGARVGRRSVGAGGADAVPDSRLSRHARPPIPL